MAGVVVGLTLDEDGIPATAEGRVKVAGKIIEEAKKYGIDNSLFILLVKIVLFSLPDKLFICNSEI